MTYWLDYHKWRQADLSRATGIEAKTISTIVRGFHTQTRQLEKIAVALKVPMDQVLVSPRRRLANEDKYRIARDVAERVLRDLENPPPLSPPGLATHEDRIVTDVLEIAEREAQADAPPAKKLPRPKKKRASLRRRQTR